jgi:hypothetical protein
VGQSDDGTLSGCVMISFIMQRDIISLEDEAWSFEYDLIFDSTGWDSSILLLGERDYNSSWRGGLKSYYT